jgi:hypothetical protein
MGNPLWNSALFFSCKEKILFIRSIVRSADKNMKNVPCSHLVLPWLVLLAFFLPVRALHAQTYTNFTTIDDPLAVAGVDSGTYVEGIYSNIVVGYFYNGTGRHGFYHVLGTSTYTTLDDPLSTSSSTTNTVAYGISGRNIIGWYVDEKGDSGNYGFLYNMDSGTYYTLDDPSSISSGVSSTEAFGIDGTNIVGYFNYNGRPGSSVFSFLSTFDPSQPGSFTYSTFYIPIPEQIETTYTNYTTELYGISGNLVVGAVVDTMFYHHGFVYDLNTSQYTFLTNSSGGIIFPYGISGNQVVGYLADPNKSFNPGGFLLTLGTTNLIVLEDPFGVEGTYAQGISDGQIVGYYSDNNGSIHGFVVGSPPVAPPIMELFSLQHNKFVFDVGNGIPNAPLLILGCTNFNFDQWTVISSNTLNSAGALNVTDVIDVTPGHEFYRAEEFP